MLRAVAGRQHFFAKKAQALGQGVRRGMIEGAQRRARDHRANIRPRRRSRIEASWGERMMAIAKMACRDLARIGVGHRAGEASL